MYQPSPLTHWQCVVIPSPKYVTVLTPSIVSVVAGSSTNANASPVIFFLKWYVHPSLVALQAGSDNVMLPVNVPM